MQVFLLVLCVVVQTSRPRPPLAADVLLMLEVRTQAFCGCGHFASSEVQKTPTMSRIMLLLGRQTNLIKKLCSSSSCAFHLRWVKTTTQYYVVSEEART